MPTKLELEQRLDVALKDNEALRLEVAQLKALCDARGRRLARTPAAPTPDVLAYRQYRDECKARAQSTGVPVIALSFSAYMAERALHQPSR